MAQLLRGLLLKYEINNKNILFKARCLRKDTDLFEYHLKCSCGYESTSEYDNAIKECPQCKTKRVFEMPRNSRRTYQFVTGYNFEETKAIVSHRAVEYYERDVDGEVKSMLDITDTDFTFEHVLNKKGKTTFKARIITNGVEEKMLKGNLWKYDFDMTNDIIKENIRKVSANDHLSYNSFAEAIWGVNVRYRLCKESIEKGVYEGYSYELSGVKEWNEFILKLNEEKDMEYLRKYIKLRYVKRERLCTSHIINFFTDNYRNIKNREKLYKHIDLLVELKNNRQVANFPASWRDIYDLANFMLKTDFTLEEVVDLIALADRQAYQIGIYMHRTCRIYSDLYEIGMPIDKKPKELAIYITKMDKLIELAGSYKYVKFKYNDLEFYGFNNKKIIKRIYDVGGYKALNNMMVAYYMNKTAIPVSINFKLSNGESTYYKQTNDILFIKNTNDNEQVIKPLANDKKIIGLLKEDNNYITDITEILEYLQDKKIELKGGAVVC